MDRARLADFLRTRREALQPEDVGLPRGRRRRTGGLRREEVAALSDMSIDYYSRLEQQRGPHPSEQMLASIARGLRLSLDERDHLFRLAGYATPHRVLRGDHVNPGMMRIFDRLEDTPAQVVNFLGETLKQTRLRSALLGDESVHTGLARSLHYRWFTDPATRLIHPEDDHPTHSRLSRRTCTPRTPATARTPARPRSSTRCWRSPDSPDLARTPRPGPVLPAETDPAPATRPARTALPDPGRPRPVPVAAGLHRVPGSESHEKLQLLSVIGHERGLTPWSGGRCGPVAWDFAGRCSSAPGCSG